MKSKIFLFLATFLMIMASCSNKNEEQMLQTVPKDTPYFGVIRIDKIMSGLGDEGKTAALQLLENAASGKSLDAKWQYIFSKDSEVDLSAPVVVFSYNRATVFTFMVKSESKFRDAMEKATGTVFSETDGVATCGNNTVFLKDSQAWFAPTYPEITTADIAVLTQLKQTESVMVLPCISKIEDSGKEISACVNMEKSLEGMLDFQSRMMVNMIFDDASYVVTDISFEKEKIVSTSNFINYKGEPSGLAFKTSRIKASSLKDFSGKGNVFFAISVDPDLVHSIIRQVKNFGVFPGDLQSALEQLDGDILVSADVTSVSDKPASMALMFTLKSKEAAENFGELVKKMFPGEEKDLRVFCNDKKCCIMTAVQTGTSVSAVADRFDKANLGAVILPAFFKGAGKPKMAEYITNCSVMLYDDGKGASIKVTLDLTGKQNALVALLEILNN